MAVTLWTVLSGLQTWARENPHDPVYIRHTDNCDLCGRQHMKRFVYHPGTGTYWGYRDEWYVVDVPFYVSDDAIEDYLSGIQYDGKHWKDGCSECSSPSLRLTDWEPEAS